MAMTEQQRLAQKARRAAKKVVVAPESQTTTAICGARIASNRHYTERGDSTWDWHNCTLPLEHTGDHSLPHVELKPVVSPNEIPPTAKLIASQMTKFIQQDARAEFLTVASGAVDTLWRQMQNNVPNVHANPLSPFAAVDAILAEADRRWPR